MVRVSPISPELGHPPYTPGLSGINQKAGLTHGRIGSFALMTMMMMVMTMRQDRLNMMMITQLK